MRALELTSRLLEAGLAGVDATLRTAQSAIDRLAGAAAPERGQAPAGAPLAGPADVDAATAELANRLLRLARSPRYSLGRAPLGEPSLAELARDAYDALRRSWPRRSLEDPRRWLTLPFTVPLSVGTLTVQETLRTLTVVQAVRPELLPDFLQFVVEVFSDLHVYFSLQYGDEIARYRRQVERAPGDLRARLELGRTYLKCGLYREALGELEAVARDASGRDGKLWRRARYEAMVASYRMGDAAGAVRHGQACLAADPADARARYWLFLSAQKAGGYPAAVPAELRMEVKAGYHRTTLELESVAAEIGLDKTSGGRGTAVFDFDGDGYLDVVIAGAHAGCSLYRNNGDGTFTDVSTGSGLDRCVYGFAVAAADYDNDGRTDLFITGLGFFNGQGILMRNDGDGTFTDVTREAGLTAWGPAFTATWLDYDRDGWLDLFVVNNLGGLFDRKTPNRLYHNNGDGTFTDVTREAGLETLWPSLGVAWGDFDNDGWPDLFVSNMGRAQLYRNNRDGTFTDVSRQAGVDAPAIGSTSLCCDVDDDGWLDVVQFTYSRPQDAIHTLRTGEGPPGGSPLRIFRNNRDGTFTDVARELGVTGCWGTMSGNAGDVNNDGRLDLLLGNGDPSMDRSEASVLLENDGRRFRDVTFAAGLPFTGKGHGVNLADLAGDGRLHVIVGAGGLYPGDLATTTVHRPKRRPGNYLNVRLAGRRGNRDAIGARLALRAGGREQHRLVYGGSGFGTLPLEQHFGLADLTRVDALEVRWPNGDRQSVAGLPVNDTVRIVEGEEGWRSVYPPRGRGGR